MNNPQQDVLNNLTERLEAEAVRIISNKATHKIMELPSAALLIEALCQSVTVIAMYVGMNGGLREELRTGSDKGDVMEVFNFISKLTKEKLERDLANEQLMAGLRETLKEEIH